MPKILAIDYGGKRCGLAETDDLQIIASALATVETKVVHEYLSAYTSKNIVETLVVGLPVRMDGSLSEIEVEIKKFILAFEKKHPGISVKRLNEAFTSKLAMDTMIRAGAKKKTRREKGNLDKISATLILQQFLEQKRNGI